MKSWWSYICQTPSFTEWLLSKQETQFQSPSQHPRSLTLSNKNKRKSSILKSISLYRYWRVKRGKRREKAVEKVDNEDLCGSLRCSRVERRKKWEWAAEEVDSGDLCGSLMKCKHLKFFIVPRVPRRNHILL